MHLESVLEEFTSGCKQDQSLHADAHWIHFVSAHLKPRSFIFTRGSFLENSIALVASYELAKCAQCEMEQEEMGRDRWEKTQVLISTLQLRVLFSAALTRFAHMECELGWVRHSVPLTSLPIFSPSLRRLEKPASAPEHLGCSASDVPAASFILTMHAQVLRAVCIGDLLGHPVGREAPGKKIHTKTILIESVLLKQNAPPLWREREIPPPSMGSSV